MMQYQEIISRLPLSKKNNHEIKEEYVVKEY